ncbi:MAG: polyprenyl synthetase family protein [Planctomycetes bacterium]|nr:polyprenyl synthetase family protein [Planctomycetota bacterium]
MIAELSTHPEMQPVHEALALGLARVRQRFDAQLVSADQPINELTEHVGRYRGKMLRPVLTLVCGLAAKVSAGGKVTAAELDGMWNQDHIIAAAVCEMVHMATLVHDDILDEADVRRGVRTINALKGNEAAVMLGDYLIAHAYDLANASARPTVSRVVSQAAVAVCAGELMQLSQRGNIGLTEAEYFRIVGGKTGALIAAACKLGAMASDAAEPVVDAMAKYGDLLGTAFQIQDDILDLTGDEGTVGKSVRKDVEKGKMTLPLIHVLRESGDDGQVARVLKRAATREWNHEDDSALGAALREHGSIEYAKQTAAGLVDRAKKGLDAVALSPVKQLMMVMADAVIDRTF